MSYNEQEYESFAKKMEEAYPKMFARPYGGIAVGAGWWPMLEQLCSIIQSHIDHMNSGAEKYPDNEFYHPVEQVTISQIKEKFGGLRFYFDGGDEYCRGAASLAESLSMAMCEECGAPGERRGGGWVRTLCDKHEAERQEAMRKYAKENGFEE